MVEKKRQLPWRAWDSIQVLKIDWKTGEKKSLLNCKLPTACHNFKPGSWQTEEMQNPYQPLNPWSLRRGIHVDHPYHTHTHTHICSSANNSVHLKDLLNAIMIPKNICCSPSTPCTPMLDDTAVTRGFSKVDEKSVRARERYREEQTEGSRVNETSKRLNSEVDVSLEVMKPSSASKCFSWHLSNIHLSLQLSFFGLHHLTTDLSWSEAFAACLLGDFFSGCQTCVAVWL